MAITMIDLGTRKSWLLLKAASVRLNSHLRFTEDSCRLVYSAAIHRIWNERGAEQVLDGTVHILQADFRQPSTTSQFEAM